MKERQYTMAGLTLAVNDMPSMLKFYTNVFEVQFQERLQVNTKLYEANWVNVKLVFCPAEVAGNTAKQNRHQFEMIVDNLDLWIDLCLKNGGQVIGNIEIGSDARSVGIYDPAQNSLVLKQFFK